MKKPAGVEYQPRQVEVEPLAEDEVEQVFVIRARMKVGQPPRLSFQPSSTRINISPRDAIMLATEGIKWCVAQEMALEREQEAELKKGEPNAMRRIWTPPGSGRVQ